MIDRLTVLNLLDRVNLIRPAEGIGIFQSAYGPRFTVLDTRDASVLIRGGRGHVGEHEAVALDDRRRR